MIFIQKYNKIVCQINVNSNYNVEPIQNHQPNKLNIKNYYISMIRTRNQNKILQQKNQQEQIKKNKHNNKQHHQQKKKSYDNQTLCEYNPEKNQQIKAVQTPKIKPKKNNVIKQLEQTDPYECQILAYLKDLQEQYRINQDYIKFHKRLTPKLRNFMIQFMFKVCWKFRCSRKTLYLAVYFFDFYMSKHLAIEEQQKVVTIAQASLHMAMKYQQIYPPSLKQWTSSQHEEQILKNQFQIIKALDFRMNFPSIYYFQQYYMQRDPQQIHEESRQNNLKIHLISDICLFDTALYAFTSHDLALNIIRLVNNIAPPFKEERIVLNIKWAIQRNSNLVEWLKQHSYKQLRDN